MFTSRYVLCNVQDPQSPPFKGINFQFSETTGLGGGKVDEHSTATCKSSPPSEKHDDSRAKAQHAWM